MKRKIEDELIKAMKSRDVPGREILRFVKGEISRAEAGIRIFSDADVQRLLSKTAENLEFATDDFSKLQLKYLIDYGFIPKKMTTDDIEKEIVSMILELPIEERIMKSMGMIMATFNSKYPGQDGKFVSSVVRDRLSVSIR